MQLNKIICKACPMNHHQAPVREQIIIFEALKHFQLYSNGNLFDANLFPYKTSLHSFHLTNMLV